MAVVDHRRPGARAWRRFLFACAVLAGALAAWGTSIHGPSGDEIIWSTSGDVEIIWATAVLTEP